MPVTPSGSISLAQRNLVTAIANSATFQTFVGAANAAAALPRVFEDWRTNPAARAYTDAEIAQILPSALVWTWDEGDGAKRVLLATGVFGLIGKLFFELERVIPEDTDLSNSELDIDFKNIAGGVMDDLCASHPEYLFIRGIAIESGPGRLPAEKAQHLGLRQCVRFIVEYGAA